MGNEEESFWNAVIAEAKDVLNGVRTKSVREGQINGRKVEAVIYSVKKSAPVRIDIRLK